MGANLNFELYGIVMKFFFLFLFFFTLIMHFLLCDHVQYKKSTSLDRRNIFRINLCCIGQIQLDFGPNKKDFPDFQEQNACKT